MNAAVEDRWGRLQYFRLASDMVVTKRARSGRCHQMLALWAQKWKGGCGVYLSDVRLLFAKETDGDRISCSHGRFSG